MLNYKIKECQITDSSAIYELNTKEMGYDYPEEKTKERIAELLASKNDKIYVAYSNDIIVGYIHANDYNLIYGPNMKNIMGIAVSSSFKRNGIGKALLATVENWARNTGASGVRLTSGSTRTGAHAFYQSCGYIGDKQQIRFMKEL